MSDTRNNIAEQLVGLTVPNLNEAGYAAQLSKTFTDINSNFVKLANRDFIKGENGDSVKIKEVDLIDEKLKAENPNFTNIKDICTGFGRMLIETIESLVTEDELSTITLENGTELKWTDYFYNNPGKLQVIYDSTAVTTDEDVAYSSLHYTFLDGRYVNNEIGKISSKEYEALKDVSCIAVYDKNINEGNGGFNIISNAFPTIYYEEGIGLCWKVNGANTGIPVQGIPGRDGINSAVHVVQATISNDNESLSSGAVTHLFESFQGFKELSADIDIYDYNNTSALILADSADTNKNGREFYFGTLKVEDEGEKLNNETNGKKVLWAYCSPSSSITSSIGVENFINGMKNIDIFATDDSASSIPKGLFIPITDEQTIDGKQVQPVHILSATSITNEEGTSSGDYKTDVIFTPVNDYNKAQIKVSDVNPEDATNIKVDKFLYLKVNTEYDTIKDNMSSIFSAFTNNEPSYDNILKYKLETIITDKESIDFNSYTPNPEGIFDESYIVSGENNSNNAKFGSRVLGIDPMKNEQFKDNNVAYIKNSILRDFNENDTADTIKETVDANATKNHYESMPVEFVNCLETNNNSVKGIYKWTLCDVKQDWDVKDLAETGDKYRFTDYLRVIYTTELTPGLNTKFLWFDGMTYFSDIYKDYLSDVNDSYFKEYLNDNKIKPTNIRGKALLDELRNINFNDLIANGKLEKDSEKHNLYKTYKEKAEKDYNLLYYVVKNEQNETIEYPILRGWQYINGYNIFTYKKFVPIYVNDFAMDKDTVLNLNYNINITGDELNPNKSITVHGHVNCDDLNVHNLTSTGEIKNIYTKDTITGDEGLNLGLNTDKTNNNVYNLTIDSLGNLKSNTISTNNVDTNNIDVNNINTEILTVHNGDINISNSNISAVTSKNNKYLHISEYLNNKASEDNIDITIGNVKNINLIKGTQPELQDDTDTYINAVNSDMPIIIKNDLSIVTNTNNVTDLDYIYKKLDSENRAKTTNNILRALKETAPKQVKKSSLESFDKLENYKETYTSIISNVYSETYTDDFPTQSTELSTNPNTINSKYIIGEVELYNSNYNGIDTKEISIEFLTDLVTHLCIVGKCSYGNWPRLSSKTCISLSAYIYDAENNNYIEVADSDSVKTYYYGFTGSDWSGYKDTGGGWGSDYGDHYRYRTYSFRPYKIKISNKDILKRINDIYSKKNNSCKLYIVVKNAVIKAYSNNKKCVRGVQLYAPRIYENTKSTSSTTINERNSLKLNFSHTSPSKISNCTVTYYNDINNSDDTSIAIVCQDGIAFKFKEHIFGIGKSYEFKETDEHDNLETDYLPRITYYNTVKAGSVNNMAHFDMKITDLYRLKSSIPSTSLDYGI